MDRRKVIIISVLSAIIFLTVSFLYVLGVFQRIDYVAFDETVQLFRSDDRISDRIAVILIDEASLEALNPIVGRWPWPRAIYSDLLEFLALGGPRAVLFDILFTEHQDRTEGKGLGPDDRQLVRATAEAGNVFHAMQLLRDREDEVNKSLIDRKIPNDFVGQFAVRNVRGSSRPADDIRSNNYYLPFTQLYRAAQGMAVVEFTPDRDGVFRRTRPLREYHETYYPVMGIAPLLQDQDIVMGETALAIGDRTLPLDAQGNYLLNFYGEFNTYSISGIFASLQKIRSGDIEGMMIDPAVFEDKLVFIGASAIGVEDLKPTPISTRTPGVYLHATLASNFLDRDFLVPPDRATTFLLTLLLTVLCVAGIFIMKRYVLKFLTPLALMFGWILFYFFSFQQNILYEVTAPLAAVGLSGLGSFGYLVITEGREKLKVRKMFSQYVSPDILSEVVDKYSQIARSDLGAKVDISVLFSDIRGFTTFSDRTPPEKVVQMLNCFFSYMSDVIFAHGGTIDKFIGDAIMAFWGAPIKMADHPERAVRAGIDMVKKVDELNRDLRDQGLDFEVRIGVGINSGDAILGNIGSEKKLNYTVVGDTVNMASRLEELTKKYKCPVIISEFTHERVRDHIPCRELDVVQVRGKQETMRIYEPVLQPVAESGPASEAPGTAARPALTDS